MTEIKSKVEIINRMHDKIVQDGKGKIMITIKPDHFYFTKRALKQFNLELGKYVHFLNDGKEWSFYQNNNTDGFPLCSDGVQKQGFKINSRPLVRLFCVQTGYNKLPVSFYLNKTNAEKAGCPIIEISTEKPIRKL